MMIFIYLFNKLFCFLCFFRFFKIFFHFLVFYIFKIIINSLWLEGYFQPKSSKKTCEKKYKYKNTYESKKFLKSK